jgi:hypothetical protein
MRTPLTELAVRAVMFLILVFLRTAQESIGRHLKTHSVFIDKLLFRISHLFYPPSFDTTLLSTCLLFTFTTPKGSDAI